MIKQLTGRYSWLSNFWPVEVILDYLSYPSVEHAYQASKTLNALDREQIRIAETPGIAKRLGKLVIIRPGWGDMKISVMEELLRQKFSDPGLAEKLMETYPLIIEEGNSWGDRFWGVYKGKGKNHLGRLLMQVRSELLEKKRGKI